MSDKVTTTKYVSENWVKSVIDENTKLLTEVALLKSKLHEETLKRESAENKYKDLCESCIKFYVDGRLTDDIILVQAQVPRFMSEVDFQTGIYSHIFNLCKAERDKVIFHKENDSYFKPKD